MATNRSCGLPPRNALNDIPRPWRVYRDESGVITSAFQKPTCGPTGRWHLYTCDDDLDLGRAAVDEEFDAVDET